MPDGTDYFSIKLREAALAYADTGPARITADDWEQHLAGCWDAGQMRDWVDELPEETVKAMHRDHLVRDATTRAMQFVRQRGRRTVKDYLRAEDACPGLWKRETFEVRQRGVFTIRNVDGDYDVPLRHLSVRHAADLLHEEAKRDADIANRLITNAEYILGLDETQLPAGATLASRAAFGVYEQMRVR